MTGGAALGHCDMPCMQVARGIEATVNLLVKELEKMSTDVSDDDLANVATVSAGNNPVVGACRSISCGWCCCLLCCGQTLAPEPATDAIMEARSAQPLCQSIQPACPHLQIGELISRALVRVGRQGGNLGEYPSCRGPCGHGKGTHSYRHDQGAS